MLFVATHPVVVVAVTVVGIVGMVMIMLVSLTPVWLDSDIIEFQNSSYMIPTACPKSFQKKCMMATSLEGRH
jgi:hypothetical protein